MKTNNEQIEYYVNKCLMKGMDDLLDIDLIEWLEGAGLNEKEIKIAFDKIRNN